MSSGDGGDDGFRRPIGFFFLYRDGQIDYDGNNDKKIMNMYI